MNLKKKSLVTAVIFVAGTVFFLFANTTFRTALLLAFIISITFFLMTFRSFRIGMQNVLTGSKTRSETNASHHRIATEETEDTELEDESEEEMHHPTKSKTSPSFFGAGSRLKEYKPQNYSPTPVKVSNPRIDVPYITNPFGSSSKRRRK